MRWTAIQVEIVKPWWDDALPIVAIVLALGTLLWTVWDRNRGAARLKVEDKGIGVAGGRDGNFVSIAVLNAGRSDSTVVSSVELVIPFDKQRVTAYWGPPPVGPSLPKKVEPGEPLEFSFDANEIEKFVAGDDEGMRRARLGKARVIVRSGHEEIKYKFPKYIRLMLSTGARRRSPSSAPPRTVRFLTVLYTKRFWNQKTPAFPIGLQVIAAVLSLVGAPTSPVGYWPSGVLVASTGYALWNNARLRR